MNNITTPRPYTNVTISYPLEYYYALFINPMTVVRFYQIGYPITFLLGFIGNIASLITFSCSTLRRVSTGCLFITLAVSDTLLLLMCVFDFVEFGLRIPFYGRIRYDELCRFRSFIFYVAQVLSSWILVTISVDRWIRTRFPYKSGSLCTPKNALLAVGVLLLIDVGLHSHILTSLYGMLIPGFSILACGPTLFSGNYLIFYLLDWTVVQILIICIIPVILMVLIFIDIFISVRFHKRAVTQSTNTTHGDHKANHHRNLQMQMFVLMTTSIFIFLTTTLPVAIYKITSPRQSNVSGTYLDVISIWTGLGWFQTLNYAVNFYSHCLTSTLFRKEFKLQIRYLLGDKQARNNTMELTATRNISRTNRY